MRVLIADPHFAVQNALSLSLRQLPVVNAVQEAGSLVQMLALCAQFCPDLILLDPDLIQPSRARQQALKDLLSVLRSLCPKAHIAFMSSRLEAAQEAQAAGVNGFVIKTDPPDEVLSSVMRFLQDND